MTVFSLLAGLVGIAGVLFSVWAYLKAERNEAVETEKAVAAAHRLADTLSMLNAAGGQAALAVELSDREEVSKKELKHILIGQLATIRAAQESIDRQETTERSWRFGATAGYVEPSETERFGQSTTDANR